MPPRKMSKNSLKDQKFHKFALILEKLFLGSRPQVVAESHKEIRITRAKQSAQIFLAASISAALAVASASSMFTHWGPNDPDFRSYIWLALVPLSIALLLTRAALHCLRHAFVILTPLGIEVFPLWRPSKTHQLIYWSELDHCDFNQRRLTLHFDKEETSGVVLSLSPLTKQQISLLRKAIQSRTMSKEP